MMHCRMMSLIAIATAFLFNCIRNMESESEIIYYRGAIAVIGDSTVSTETAIYGSNLDFPVRTSGSQPVHPAANGSFRIAGVEFTHPTSRTVYQWECGPLRILIENPAYITYNDSLTNEQLKSLQQNDSGEWVLPVITLNKR